MKYKKCDAKGCRRVADGNSFTSKGKPVGLCTNHFLRAFRDLVFVPDYPEKYAWVIKELMEYVYNEPDEKSAAINIEKILNAYEYKKTLSQKLKALFV